jgi:hypothetical protein
MFLILQHHNCVGTQTQQIQQIRLNTNMMGKIRRKKFKDLDVDIKTIVSKITNNSAFNKGYLERWLLTKDEKIITKFISLSKIFRFVRDCNKVLKGKNSH